MSCGVGSSAGSSQKNISGGFWIIGRNVPSKLCTCAAHTGHEASAHKKTWSIQNCIVQNTGDETSAHKKTLGAHKKSPKLCLLNVEIVGKCVKCKIC